MLVFWRTVHLSLLVEPLGIEAIGQFLHRRSFIITEISQLNSILIHIWAHINIWFDFYFSTSYTIYKPQW